MHKTRSSAFLYALPLALLLIGVYQLTLTARWDVGLIFIVVALVLTAATFLYQRRWSQKK